MLENFASHILIVRSAGDRIELGEKIRREFPRVRIAASHDCSENEAVFEGCASWREDGMFVILRSTASKQVQLLTQPWRLRELPPYVLKRGPWRSGGTGRAEVERFYREHFVGHWPDDVEVKQLSRTSGDNRVIDELIVSFTHDREMRAFLPGVAPTGRKVVLPHVVVMGFDETGRVAYEHIYWDQASLLVQVGLLDLLPVVGAEQARRLLDPTQPANEVIQRSQLRGARVA